MGILNNQKTKVLMTEAGFSSKFTLQVFSISIGVSLLTFISQIIIARNLNPKDFAAYASIGALINIAGVLFSSLLLSQVKVIKANSGTFGSKFFDRGTLDVLLVSLLLAGAFVIFLTTQNTGSRFSTIFLAAAFIPITAIMAGLNAKFQGLGRLRTLNFMTLATVSLSVSAHFLLVQTGTMGVNNALLVSMLSNILTLFIFSRALPAVGLEGSSIFSTSALKVGLLSGGYWFFVNADILLSPLWLGESDRGEYSSASSVAKILVIAAGVLNGLFLNSLLNHKRTNPKVPSRLIVKYFSLAAGLSFCFVVAIFLMGEPAFKFVFGLHLSSEPGFLLRVCLTGVPLVFAGLLVQVLIAYFDSWAAGLVVWLLSGLFLSFGGFVETKSDLALSYTLGGVGVLSTTLAFALIFSKRK